MIFLHLRFLGLIITVFIKMMCKDSKQSVIEKCFEHFCSRGGVLFSLRISLQYLFCVLSTCFLIYVPPFFLYFCIIKTYNI